MSKAKPNQAQLEFLDWELGAFLHFGIRTFNEENRDWDMKPMDPKTFNPTELDCDKWADDLYAAGVKYAIMTTKHHDGFALWPSAYTAYSVKASDWKNGKGDVVREYTDAMRKKGLKCGLYYSCSQFDAKEIGTGYNDFVIGQIRELLSGYGKIDLIWFDGCGSNGDTYDTDLILKTIYDLQPDIKVFGFGSSFGRWIGNEWGHAHMVNSNIVTSVATDLTHADDALDAEEFRPGECDCCMVRNGSENFWFYTETYNACLRTREEIIGLYYYSIGRGANLLINLAPDRRGLLQENNMALLSHMTNEMKRRLTDCRLQEQSKEKNGNEYTLTFEPQKLIDHVVLEEDMTDGQNIHGFTVYASPYKTEARIAVYKGFTVGHRQICTFPPIRAKHIEIVIDAADDGEKLNNYYACYVSGNEQIYQIDH